MVNRYISADALLFAIKKNAPYVYHLIAPIVMILPSADVVKVKHGFWKDDRMNIMCSVCGAKYSEEIVFMNQNFEYKRPKHCPECGARMDGEANEKD